MHPAREIIATTLHNASAGRRSDQVIDCLFYQAFAEVSFCMTAHAHVDHEGPVSCQVIYKMNGIEYSYRSAQSQKVTRCARGEMYSNKVCSGRNTRIAGRSVTCRDVQYMRAMHSLLVEIISAGMISQRFKRCVSGKCIVDLLPVINFPESIDVGPIIRSTLVPDGEETRVAIFINKIAMTVVKAPVCNSHDHTFAGLNNIRATAC